MDVAWLCACCCLCFAAVASAVVSDVSLCLLWCKKPSYSSIHRFSFFQIIGGALRLFPLGLACGCSTRLCVSCAAPLCLCRMLCLVCATLRAALCPRGVLNSPKSLAFLCSAFPLACGCVGLDGAALSMRLRAGQRLWLRWWLSVWRPSTPWSLVADGWAVGLRRLRELGLVGLRLRPAFGLGRSAS
jgi:hypothetical protein